MAFSNINRVVLIGRLTRDPELRALPSGHSVCSLRVACNSSRRDAEGEYHERPSYFDVSAFGGHAEGIGRYTRRGSLVAIDGRLEWREWETAEQQRRQAVSILADSVQFLDSPHAPEDAAPGGEDRGRGGGGADEDNGGGRAADEAQDAAEEDPVEQPAAASPAGSRAGAALLI